MSTKKSSDKDTEADRDVQSMSFEEARESLEDIVTRLEAGDVSLDESIKVYILGTKLLKHCESKLISAQEQVEKIVTGPDGTIDTEPTTLD
tara:strand:+ start:2675 stop:2947 length:273 start_codon:yes stop_codon:yes gene_type:complete